MKLLVATGKPVVSRWIAKTVQATWPNAEVTFVHLVPYGNLRFSYPRGLKLQDYPRIAEPAYKLNACANWACRPLSVASDSALTVVSMRLELFAEADLIVFAGDPSHAEAGAFEVIMREVFGDDRAMACPAVELYGFDEKGLNRSFANLRPVGELFAQTLQYGRIKRYFDFNWNMNALTVMGDAMRRAGVSADAPPLSKYALQLLYELRHEAPCADNVIHQKMNDWKGTGRYQYAKGEWRPRLGSAASRSQIIDNLTEAGLLVRVDNVSGVKLTVSPRAHKLLELLHRDCQDMDIPFRIHAWCEEGEAAKPAIDRYIKTVFGKQLRFSGK